MSRDDSAACRGALDLHKLIIIRENKRQHGAQRRVRRNAGSLLLDHSPAAAQCCILFLICQLQHGAAFSIRDTTGVSKKKKEKKDRIGSGPHTAHCTADADFMPLCSVFGGNNSRRRPHTPTSFCSPDKVAAIGRRGSALQLASCRLGDDCQGPSRGRINSSCSSWRGARPSGDHLRQHADKRPLEFGGERVRVCVCALGAKEGLAVRD